MFGIIVQNNEDVKRKQRKTQAKDEKNIRRKMRIADIDNTADHVMILTENCPVWAGILGRNEED